MGTHMHKVRRLEFPGEQFVKKVRLDLEGDADASGFVGRHDARDPLAPFEFIREGQNLVFVPGPEEAVLERMGFAAPFRLGHGPFPYGFFYVAGVRAVRDQFRQRTPDVIPECLH